MIAVSDDDGVTEDWFWKFVIVFRGVLDCYGGCGAIVASGWLKVYIGSFNERGDRLCLRPSGVFVYRSEVYKE